MKKKILSVCLAAAMIMSCTSAVLSASAVEVTDETTQAVLDDEASEKSHNYNGIIYRITLKGEVNIIGYTGDSSSLNIPDQLENKPVTSISLSAFRNQTGIRSIALPYGLREISNRAFENCSSLENIIIPETVTSIGSFAFRDCTSLSSITLPQNLTKIGWSAFENCYDLESITIPDEVTSIGREAFKSCTALKEVTLPNGIAAISAETFQDCVNLETVVIPNSASGINSEAFKGCIRLKSIYIPARVKYIGANVFDGCERLTVYGKKYSTAEIYAVGKGIPFRTYPSSSSGIKGDVDGDGIITSNDALLVLRYSVQLEEFDEDIVEQADVNGDGKADSSDSLSILRYSVGLRDYSILER